MHKTFLCLIFILMTAVSLSSLTIHSTASGGNWTDPNSWIEHVVPDSTMDVEITSAVFVNQAVFCRDATIANGGTLKNAYISYSSHTLTIRRNLLNFGIIANNSGTNSYYGSLVVKIEGNLAFCDGQIINAGITLSGTHDQMISMADSVAMGNSLTVSKTTGSISLGSDFNLGSNTLSMGTRNLNLGVYRLKNGTLGNGTVSGGNLSGLEDMSLGSLTLSGLHNLYGSTLITNGSVVFQDSVVNNGTLRNAYVSLSYHSLSIKGSLINLGTITNNNNSTPSSGSLLLVLEGDFTFLDGLINNAGINLVGANEQIIAMSDSVAMGTSISVSKTSGSISLGSNFNMGGYTLSMGTRNLTLNEFIFKNGTIGNGYISGGVLSALENVSLSTITLSGLQNLYGSIWITNNSVVFQNDVNNFGTLKNSYVSFSSYTFTIKGNLNNLGDISNYNGTETYYGSLVLRLEGDLAFQDGLINNAGITLVGTNDQTIAMSDSVAMGTSLTVSKTSGSIELSSDFNLGSNTLNLGTKNLILGDYRLKNGSFSNGSVMGGDLSGLENLSFGSLTFSETQNLYGSNWITNGSVVFQDDVNNYGTLKNSYVSYSSYTFTIKGNLENLGDVSNYNGAETYYGSLVLRLEGDLAFQDGLINNAGITLVGTNDQTIAMSDSVAMGTSLTVSKTSGSIELCSDFNLGNNTLNLGTKNLILGDYRLKNGSLSNGSVMGGDLSGLENLSFGSLTLSGVQNLYGSNWITNGSVVFQNGVNNYGTLKNSYVSYGVHTLVINGYLCNQGVITNNNGSSYYHGFLSLNLCGSLLDRGTINCASLILSGVGSFTVDAPSVSSPITISGSNFVFTGTNVMPGFTVANTSVCSVGENATLTLPIANSSISGTISNFGRISLKRSTNTTSDKSYYYAVVRPNADYAARVSNLAVETNCYSIPGFFQDAVKIWWNLIPSNVLPNLSLSQIVLQYSPDMLNGYSQSALEVVHSYDGISWIKLNSAVIDSINHKVTVSNAPGMGYYAFTKTSQVSGRVVGYNDPGTGLANVMITHGNQYSITQTNASGYFSFNIPNYYGCSVIFNKSGYNPVSQTFRVWASDVNVGDVLLPEELNTPDTFTAVQNNLGTSVVLSWGYNTKAFGAQFHGASQNPDQREFSNYSVYRFLYGEESNTAVWTLLSTQTELSYTDLAWANLAFGVYRYAVIANYSNGSFSEPIFSAQVQRRGFSISENFDSPILPVGWTVQHSGSTTFPWTPVLDVGTDYSLKVLNSVSNTASEKLLSPTFNCSRYQKIQVEFWHDYVSNTNSSAIFQISTNGITWTNIQNFAAVADSGNKVYDISSFAANQSNVRFRWSFTATSSSPNYWNVDDFCLSGYTPIAVYFAKPYPDAEQLDCHNLNVSIGIMAIDDELINAASLQYRIDANGNGSYDPGETWNPVPSYPDSQILEIRVTAQYAVDGNSLKYEFKGEDLAGTGFSYSGSMHQDGIMDDYYVNIDTAAPSTVSDLAATSISTTEAVVSWTPITDPDFLRYELYISKTGSVDLSDICWLPADNPALGIRTTDSLTMNSLELNCYYWFAIRAVDRSGNASDLSSSVMLTPLSIPPEITASIPGNQPNPAWQTIRTVTLGCSFFDYYGIENSSLKFRFDMNGNGIYDPSEAWQDVPSSAIVPHDPNDVSRKESFQQSTSSGNPRSRNIRSLVSVQLPVAFSCDGHALHYEFQAQDINGYTGYSGLNGQEGISDDWIVKIDTVAPTAIANLNQPLVTDTAVELSWDASSDAYFKTYEVYYANHAEIGLADSLWNCLNDSLLAYPGSGSIITQITGLLPHNFYRFRVRAIDQAGNYTPLSNEVHAYFGEISSPLSPSGFIAIRQGNDLSLSWQPVEEDVYGNPLSIDWYNIYVGFTPDFPADQDHYLDSSISTTYLHTEVFSYPIQSLFYKITAEYGIGFEDLPSRFSASPLLGQPSIIDSGLKVNP